MPLKLSALLRPFEDFFKLEAAAGMMLLLATAVALVLGNSPWGEDYRVIWQLELGLTFAGFSLVQTLQHWINDGLMALFFLVVGLEIKRELLAGELSRWRRAALPFAAALGGMLVPALIYLLCNLQTGTLRGWGVPMATDIAFALGAMALLGKRVPRSLVVFLVALAIVDDIWAVLIIAIFYSSAIDGVGLAAALALFALLLAGNRAGIQHPLFYALVGLALWGATLASGIHATVAGVLIGFSIPVQARVRAAQFLPKAEHLLEHYRGLDQDDDRGPFLQQARMGTLLAMEHVCHDAIGPLQRLEHELHGWVSYLAMPLFALANAGIAIDPELLLTVVSAPLAQGVFWGLLLGKPLGIVLFSWLAVRAGVAELPERIVWGQVLGVGLLGGVGFTMSLFVTRLAFVMPEQIAQSTVAIFAASLIAGLAGLGWLSQRSS